MLVKKTYSLSAMNDLVKTLKKEKKNHHLGFLGKVEATGINVDVYLRILVYHGGVMLEQLRRLNDVNEERDDVIISEIYNFDQVPDKHPLIRVMDYFDYTDCKEFQDYVIVIKFKKHITQFLN